MSKSKNTINLTLERSLWDELSRFAGEQTIIQGQRYSTINALRSAIRILLRLELSEITKVLKREPRIIE